MSPARHSLAHPLAHDRAAPCPFASPRRPSRRVGLAGSGTRRQGAQGPLHPPVAPVGGRASELAFLGAYARGGRVLQVTTLEDHGRPGSLRWAVGQKGPRVVEFTVAGAISLRSNLTIEEPYLTLDGSTGPAGASRFATPAFAFSVRTTSSCATCGSAPVTNRNLETARGKAGPRRSSPATP